jgi:hypothetical protein
MTCTALWNSRFGIAVCKKYESIRHSRCFLGQISGTQHVKKLAYSFTFVDISCCPPPLPPCRLAGAKQSNPLFDKPLSNNKQPCNGGIIEMNSPFPLQDT